MKKSTSVLSKIVHRLSWLSLFSKTFIKTIAFENFIANSLALQKWRGVQFLTFLTNSYCNIFWTTSATEFVRTIFRGLFEDTTITTNFLKSHICNTSCIKINAFFAILNNKGLENFKVRPNHSILKGMDAG